MAANQAPTAADQTGNLAPVNRPVQIDWEFIRGAESEIWEPYLPVRRDRAGAWQPIMRSGVTVGSGIDLGQQTREFLGHVQNAQLRASLTQKLEPFLGKHKGSAANALVDAENRGIALRQRSQPELMSTLGISSSDSIRQGPNYKQVHDHTRGKLTPHKVQAMSAPALAGFALSPAEVQALEDVARSLYTERLVSNFERTAAVTKGGRSFGRLPKRAQTVCMSLFYNTGSRPSGTRFAGFWRAALRGEIVDMVFELEDIARTTTDPGVRARRQSELSYLIQLLLSSRSGGKIDR